MTSVRLNLREEQLAPREADSSPGHGRSDWLHGRLTVARATVRLTVYIIGGFHIHGLVSSHRLIPDSSL